MDIYIYIYNYTEIYEETKKHNDEVKFSNYWRGTLKIEFFQILINSYCSVNIVADFRAVVLVSPVGDQIFRLLSAHQFSTRRFWLDQTR